LIGPDVTSAPGNRALTSSAFAVRVTRRHHSDLSPRCDEERDAVREGVASLVVSDAELKAFRNRHKA
jgi:hypothetical protein